jgi:hypothetical protein
LPVIMGGQQVLGACKWVGSSHLHSMACLGHLTGRLTTSRVSTII